MSQYYNDSIFWIDIDKIKPNPYQPRREFEPAQLHVHPVALLLTDGIELSLQRLVVGDAVNALVFDEPQAPLTGAGVDCVLTVPPRTGHT